MWILGRRVERAEVRGLAQRLDARAGQGSPADLDDEVVQAVTDLVDGQARSVTSS